MSAPGTPPAENMMWVPGGTFLMGSDRHYPEEAPAHRVSVDGFWMDRTPVTNCQFRRFVEDTGYTTSAEIAPDPAQYPGALPEMLQPASVVFVRTTGPVDLLNHFAWWRFIPGADWRHPQGPGSSIEGLDEHPVVHVAFTTSRRMRPGPARSCRPRPSGRCRARRPRGRGVSPGVRSSLLAAGTWRTPGRASFPGRTSSRTGSSVRRPSTRFRPTATASAT